MLQQDCQWMRVNVKSDSCEKRKWWLVDSDSWFYLVILLLVAIANANVLVVLSTCPLLFLIQVTRTYLELTSMHPTS